MKEQPSPCQNCTEKPCENNPYNPDHECWPPATITQLIALGGKAASQLVEKLISNKGIPSER